MTIMLNSCVGFYICPTYDGIRDDTTRDSLTKALAAEETAKLSPDQIDLLRESVRQARLTYPDADVVEVRVVLSDGDHDFTWDEFTVWLASD